MGAWEIYTEMYTHLPTKLGNEGAKMGGRMTHNAFIPCLQLLIPTLFACSNSSRYVMFFQRLHRREGEKFVKRELIYMIKRSSNVFP